MPEHVYVFVSVYVFVCVRMCVLLCEHICTYVHVNVGGSLCCVREALHVFAPVCLCMFCVYSCVCVCVCVCERERFVYLCL